LVTIAEGGGGGGAGGSTTGGVDSLLEPPQAVKNNIAEAKRIWDLYMENTSKLIQH